MDKESACNAGDPGLIPGSGRSPGEGNSNSLQYSCLENSIDRGAWQIMVYGVAKNQTRLKRLSFLLFSFNGCSQKMYCGPSQVVLVVKNPPARAGEVRDVGSIPGSGRSHGEENSTPLQYSCLENSIDRGAWQATVHGIARSWT